MWDCETLSFTVAWQEQHTAATSITRQLPAKAAVDRQLCCPVDTEELQQHPQLKIIWSERDGNSAGTVDMLSAPRVEYLPPTHEWLAAHRGGLFLFQVLTFSTYKQEALGGRDHQKWHVERAASTDLCR